MVRFIMQNISEVYRFELQFTFQYGQIYYKVRAVVKGIGDKIYIPIWLDLLSEGIESKMKYFIDLHSNMVRFIMIDLLNDYDKAIEFTFQYGQIYYSHVRLFRIGDTIFTFQYGQIYYLFCLVHGVKIILIYIPIWLDLLYLQQLHDQLYYPNLHSNMVRFIIIC